MAEPASTGGGAAVLSVAGILAATPFGLSMETIFIATGFTMLGAFARVGFEISAMVEAPTGIQWSRIWARLASSLISAATIAVLVLVMLKILNVQSEPMLVFLLIAFGYSGSTGIPWLLNTMTGMVGRLTGLKLPSFSSPLTQSSQSSPPTGEVK